MPKLTIVGVDAEAAKVHCEHSESGERLTLDLDERFKAAARGEYAPHGGSSQTGVTGSLRPREIQDKIRHGASSEDVAAEAGVPVSRIEGFALPVLLERATAAEQAQRAHPVLSDGPALCTLGERVEESLSARGIDPDVVRWDAWRNRAGSWTVRTYWPAGLSDDAAATWTYTPDSHGGSALPLNEEAETILDPSRAAALRLAPGGQPTPPQPPPISAVPTGMASPPLRPVSRPEPDRARPERTRPEPVAPPAREQAKTEDSPEEEDFLQHPPADPQPKTPRRHPTMPSWEDVLLGVRGKDE